MRVKPRLTKINRENSKLAGLNGDSTRIDQDTSREFKASRIKWVSNQD